MITKTQLQDIISAQPHPPQGYFEVSEFIDDDHRRLSLAWTCDLDKIPDGMDPSDPWDAWGGCAIAEAAGLDITKAISADDQYQNQYGDMVYTSYAQWTLPLETKA